MTGIEFLQNACLTVYESQDDTGTQESFTPGARAEADIFSDHDDGTVDIQFGDGSVALGVPKTLFKEVTL